MPRCSHKVLKIIVECTQWYRLMNISISVPEAIYCAIYYLVYPEVFLVIYILRVVPRGTDKFFCDKIYFFPVI